MGSSIHMDHYTVIFLIPSSGNRVVLNGVQADVQMKEGVFYEHKGPLGVIDHIMPMEHPFLEITLTMNHADMIQLEEVKIQLFSEEIFLSFKDVHPCLIRGQVLGMNIGDTEVTIDFKGHAIDKTYDDFVTEATDQLNAYQYYLETPTAEENMHSIPDEPEEVINDIMNQLDKEKKGKVIKRKLTF